MNERKRSLEERLGATDFSDQSEVRDELRWELMSRFARENRPAGAPRGPRGRLDMFKRPVPAFGLGILVALLALTLAHPDGRAALAKIPGLLHIGEHTAIVTESMFSNAELDSIVTAASIEQAKGRQVFQMTPYGGWGGTVPPGGDPYFKEYNSLGLAAAAVDYELVVPTYFNELIPERMRFQKAVIAPAGQAQLYFGIGWLETVLSFTSVAEGGMVTYSESVTTTDEDGNQVTTIVQPELEEMQVGDLTVTWHKHSDGARNNLGGLAVKKKDVEIGRFLWEQDGLSISLNGKFLTKEEGVKIIESLKVYRAD